MNFLRRLMELVEVCALFSILFPILGLFGKYYWLLDLFSHFRIQYFVCLLIASILFFIAKKKYRGAVCLIVGILLASTLVKYYIPEKTMSEGMPLKVISYNVNTANERHEEVLTFLTSEEADVIFLMEVDGKWLEKLSNLDEIYPYQITKSREDNFGVALYSKYELFAKHLMFFGEAGVPSLDVVLKLEDKSVRFIGTHPAPPYGEIGSLRRNAHLSNLATHVQDVKEKYVIVAGDFNVTPFSHYFEQFLEDTDLKDSSIGFGILPTWMRNMPWFAIPIDHVFLTNSVSVVDKKLGDTLGSDHNPIILQVTCND